MLAYVLRPRGRNIETKQVIIPTAYLREYSESVEKATLKDSVFGAQDPTESP